MSNSFQNSGATTLAENRIKIARRKVPKAYMREVCEKMFRLPTLSRRTILFSNVKQPTTWKTNNKSFSGHPPVKQCCALFRFVFLSELALNFCSFNRKIIWGAYLMRLQLRRHDVAVALERQRAPRRNAWKFDCPNKRPLSSRYHYHNDIIFPEFLSLVKRSPIVYMSTSVLDSIPRSFMITGSVTC